MSKRLLITKERKEVLLKMIYSSNHNLTKKEMVVVAGIELELTD